MTNIPLLSFTVPAGQGRMIALTDLTENTHGATNYLKNTLRSTGQLDAILVEELPHGEYRIREGNRRVAAARSLNWTEIRAEVYQDLTEVQWALLVTGTHNRSENPVEEARQYRVLSRTLTPEGVAANTGHPLSRIRARLALFNLPDDVLEMIGTKTLSLGVAERASKLRGVFLDRAVQGIRVAAAKDGRYGSQELKEVTVARTGLLGSLLMAAAPPPMTLIPASEVLALEVRELCSRRGVDLETLLEELSGPSTPVQDTVRARVS